MDFQLSSLPTLFSLPLFVFMVMIILKRSSKPTNTSSKLPPGPWKLPIIGNLHQLLSPFPHRVLKDLARKYGPLMYVRIGQVPTLVVSSAEFAKEVMRTHDIIFAYRPTILISQTLLYNSADIFFSPYGEYWRQLRKICMQELLSGARVQSFRPVREEEMSNLVQGIASNVGSAINLTERIFSSSYTITARTAFGKKSKDQDEFISIVMEGTKIGSGFDLADVFPSFGFLDPLLFGRRAKLEKLHRKNDRILSNIINEHDKEKPTAKSSESETVTEDLVDVLLKFHNNDSGFSLTTDNLKAIIFDIFAAGTETSATGLDWAMAELIRNPKVMKKAQNEVREVFCRKGSIDETAISEMKYLKSVVKETLRLHPSAPLITRECGEKCEINGYEIPAKTRVVINAWAIGRDPRYWTDPESFIPERFLDSPLDYKGTNFEYIPFGAGRRICPGVSFGVTNIEVPLTMLLYHFDWKLPASGMKHEVLDMTEVFGTTVRRKEDLHLVPIAYDLSPIEKTAAEIT
ncbi:cytochrome P450 71D11-like [Morus notabilis]|uniref:cytochrome P450 71D11-like n=1 Tax=Morus notabilis TaxID=981085 RepID=UPI000CED7248|nr:cytochrome P450 71D11-like [Morus notabilis]